MHFGFECNTGGKSAREGPRGRDRVKANSQGPTSETVIFRACRIGNWDEAVRWFLGKARDEFQDFESSQELEEGHVDLCP